MIAANVPKHLVVGARTGFLTGVRETQLAWQQVGMTLNMTTAAQQLVDLGAPPMPVESKAGTTVQDFIEKEIEVKPKSWDITVWISQDAIDDDQTGDLNRYVRGAGRNFQKHIDKEAMRKHGIEIVRANFSPPVYPQLWGDFIYNLSTLDLLLNCGPKSKEIVLRRSNHSD